MRYVVVDLEATCWEDSSWRLRKQMEIIEIGAVRLDENLEVLDEFQSFVRPVVNRRLSDFCTELTTIRQADVDAADLFPAVFKRFVAWIGDSEHRLCSWGAYDLNQFRMDCRRFGVVLPAWFEAGHANIKKEFTRWKRVKRCGMVKALAHLGLSLEGSHHRGIDDARNTARIAQHVLPHVDHDLLNRMAEIAD